MLNIFQTMELELELLHFNKRGSISPQRILACIGTQFTPHFFGKPVGI